MNNRILSSFAICACVLSSCAGNQTIENFEGALENWNIEGEAFATESSSGSLSGYLGSAYLRSSENEDAVGSAESAPFTIKKDFINMLVAGSRASYGRSPLKVSLVIDGEEVISGGSVSQDQNTFDWVSWDVAQYKGKTASIKLTAAQGQSFGGRRIPRGFIAVDEISQSNTRLSSYYDTYKVSVKADKKYILIPASNNGSNSRLSVMCQDENILGIAQSAKPAVDRIDYYIPVNVEKYKGKTLDVILTGIRATDAVFGSICTSDTDINEHDEQYRPLVHYSPDFGWTNDPNGMVLTPDGEWHLSLQYNPYGTSHGNMHWGLATSRDLIHWTDTPAIIAPDDLGSIFSGSAVVDHDNTAGFGKDAIVAIYTSAGQGQRQSIAYSTDGGYSFTKYDKNPVLSDPQQRDFRDPKVSWVKDHWVMALAVGQVVRFYGSADLKDWSLLSEFGTGIGSHAGTWECPDLMCFDYEGKTKWVLFVSINPGGPNGGSITQYFIGDFDGKTFKADPLPYPLWVDEGVDNYAGVTFSNTTGRTVFMGWMSNWSYTGQTPTLAFRNAMTLPRDLSLKSNGKHLILSSVPSPEVYAARASEKSVDGVSNTSGMTISSILENNKGAYEIDATITPDSKGVFCMSLSNTKGEKMIWKFDTKNQKLSLDRSQSGNVSFADSFAKEPVVVSLNPRPQYKIQLFVDKLSTELFINDGDMVFTNCAFPSEGFNSFGIESSDCKVSVNDIKVYELK